MRCVSIRSNGGSIEFIAGGFDGGGRERRWKLKRYLISFSVDDTDIIEVCYKFQL